LGSGDDNAAVHAARTLQLLGEKTRPVLPALEDVLPRIRAEYARRSIEVAIASLTEARKQGPE